MNYVVNSYVKKFFKMYFLTCYNESNKNEINILINQIGDNLAKKYDTEEILSGTVDNILFRTIEKYIKNNKTNLWEKYINLKNYITKYICTNVNVMYSKDTLDYLVDRVSNRLIASVNYQDLMEGKIDELVLPIYYEVANKLCQRIYNYTRGYIIENAVPINEIDEVKISKDIVEEIMASNKYNVTDLLMGRCNKVIEDKVTGYRLNNERTRQSSVDYIYLYLLEKFDDYLSFDEVMEYALYIDNYLRNNQGFTTKEITSHKYDSDIVKLYSLKRMKNNSVQIDEERSRIKHEKRKRKVQHDVASLLILAALVGLFGTAAHELVKGAGDRVDGLSADMRYNFVSSQMNGNRYDYLFTKYSDGYINNMQFVIEDYINYSKLGVVYGYLGFYEAYKHNENHSLAIMDSMLREIDFKLLDGKYKCDLKIDTYYFIEFAYNRLVEMGCEEIQQEKYINAVDGYKRASWSNDDKNKTTMDYIHENDKELEKTIVEMMEIYHEYSSKRYKELSEIYVSNETKGRF